ncbi:MAG: hypothetical protein IIA44_15445 [Acidobacteria bacterium]|nr:hypothetical protein [Acidobacteriota bacterium]
MDRNTGGAGGTALHCVGVAGMKSVFRFQLIPKTGVLVGARKSVVW